MTPDQWRRVNELYHAALDVPPERRSHFVTEKASDDGTVARELQRLLEIDPDRTAVIDDAIMPAGQLGNLLFPGMLHPGDRLAGRYRIDRELGSGGMGHVYEAMDLELNVRIALKIIRPDLAGDARVVARFKQEVQLARQVTHPNVCRAYDLVRTTHHHSDLLFLCMEHVEGETLAVRLRRTGKMTRDEAAGIIQQMAAGLHAAHTAGIVHRDLKSGNVFLSRDRDGALRVVLADFGLAGNLTREQSATQTSSGWAVGTPAYMAPEQVEGGRIGPAADIYALGVVMYEMATGQLPYEGMSPLQVALKRLKERPKPPRELDAAVDPLWEAAILRCLEIDPAHRFATALEAAEALRTPSRPIPRAAEPGRTLPLPGRRNTLLAAAGVALAGTAYYATWPAALAPDAARWYTRGVESLQEGAPVTAQKRLAQALQLAPNSALLHARLAQAYLDLDQGDRAREELVRASQFMPDRWRISARERHLIAGIQALSLRDFGPAVREFSALTTEGNAAEQASAWVDLGRIHAEAGQTKDALTAFRQAATLDRQSGAARLQSAMMLARQQKQAEALPLFDEASKLFDLAGNAEGLGAALLEKGRALRDSKSLPEARPLLAKALEIAKAGDRRALEVATLFAQSSLAVREGDTVESERLARRGLELADKEKLEILSARGLNDLGSAALAQYKLKEARRYLEQAIQMAERTRSGQTLAGSRTSLASLVIREGNAAAAPELLRQAADFYRQGNYREQLLLTMLLEADALLALNDHAGCIRLASELRDRAKAEGNSFYVSRGLARIAYSNALIGNAPVAAQAYAEADVFHRAAGRKAEVAYGAVNRGWALDLAGETAARDASWQEAERLLAALGASGKSGQARLDYVRAESALREGRYPDAARLARAAMGGAAESAGRRAMGLLVLMSALAHLGDHAGARQAAAECRTITAGMSFSEIGVLVGLRTAQVAWLTGDRPAALAEASRVHAEAERVGLALPAFRLAALLAALGEPSKVTTARQNLVKLAGEAMARTWEHSMEFKEYRKEQK